METQIFHHAKSNLQKNPLKETQNPSKYYNSITKSQVSTLSQNIMFQNPHNKNRPIIIT
jgi:hypothetical protein